jgi:hypothetical protein
LNWAFDLGFSQANLKGAGCFAATKEVGEMQGFLATSEGTPRVEETPLTPVFS